MTGLPDVARIITVGQEMVVPGEQVEAVFEPAPNMPASRPQKSKPKGSPAGAVAPSEERAAETLNAPGMNSGGDRLDKSAVASS